MLLARLVAVTAPVLLFRWGGNLCLGNVPFLTWAGVRGGISVALNTAADVVVACAAGGIRAGAAARPGLIRRLREGSGAAMVALGIGLALARRPAG